MIAGALSAFAWALALLQVWAYGRSAQLGGAIGLGCAISFIALAGLTLDLFMALANTAFLALHAWNLARHRPRRHS
jgi:hypothetical protein